MGFVWLGDMEEPFIDDAKVFEDERGYFHPFVNDSAIEIAQVNHLFSVQNILRGMHFQAGQAKYIYCPIGEIYYTIVDMRKESPTYKKWQGFTLSGKNRKKLFVPEGYAHGFYVSSPTAHLIYAVSKKDNPKKESNFDAFDKEIGIKWPCESPILSPSDKKAASFSRPLS